MTAELPWSRMPSTADNGSMNTRPVRAMLWAGAVAHLGYSWLIRPWHLQWGATADEVRRPMPGDERIPHPMVCATRGITIEAPPESVWPWIAQMGGYTRAGWYSYDRFDNAGVPSAERIIWELQRVEPGDVLLTSPHNGFTVREVEPGSWMVLEILEGESRITSVPMVSPLSGGRSRLVIRVRAYFEPRHRVFWAAFDIGDFVFMRKQLKGIQRRAEQTPRGGLSRVGAR